MYRTDAAYQATGGRYLHAAAESYSGLSLKGRRIMYVSEMTEKYKCDSGHVFVGRDVLLQPMSTNFHAPFAQFAFVDKDGKTMWGCPQEGDQVLACPVCKEVHLGGFDKAE